jgi:hypothetical protein
LTPAVEEFLSLLNYCLKHNVSEFNNDFDEFSDGLPTGSPIAPLMAEVSTSKFEKEILTSNNLFT